MAALEISLLGLATAAAAGAISFLSPCVLPLVPGYPDGALVPASIGALRCAPPADGGGRCCGSPPAAPGWFGPALLPAERVSVQALVHDWGLGTPMFTLVAGARTCSAGAGSDKC